MLVPNRLLHRIKVVERRLALPLLVIVDEGEGLLLPPLVLAGERGVVDCNADFLPTIDVVLFVRREERVAPIVGI